MFDQKSSQPAPNLVDGLNLSNQPAIRPPASRLGGPAAPSVDEAGAPFTPVAPVVAPQTEDIFAETDQNALVAGPVAVKPRSDLREVTPPAPVLPEPLSQLPDDLEEETGSNKKFFWVGLAVLIVVLAGGGYFVYAKFFGAGPSLNLPQFNINVLTPSALNQQLQNDVLNLNLNRNANVNESAEQNQNNNDNNSVNQEPVAPLSEQPAPVEPEPAADSDKDGLSDEEEDGLGTNKMEADSDNDQLSDREEVRVYETDPLNPDSDGDGYLDGAEVDNGYNPKGSGKLLDINF